MLRVLAVLVALTAAVPSARAQDGRVEAAITAVTVYQRGAQVTRTGAARVPAGTTVLTFAGLTSELDPQSVQLRAEGPFTVLSVVHRRNFLEGEGPTAAVTALETTRAVLRDSLEAVQAMIEVYAQEEALLLANQNLGGTEGVAVAELRAAAAFFRERLAEIKRARLALHDEAEALQEALRDLDRQLAELRDGRAGRPTSEVDVTVVADAAAQGTFTLSYLTYAAGWTPRYDVRVEDVGGPVALAYKADVLQRTGEDWQNVYLALSTGDPAQPGTTPTLQPWRIGFAPDRTIGGLDEVVVSAQSREEAHYADAPLANMPSPPPSVRQVTGLTTTRFEIDLPYTIPSDGKPYTVAVQAYDVPADYVYYTAPKLDPHAYLTARLTEWADLGLLSGEVHLFLEGAFVGTSVLDIASTQDTLVLSLGRDEGIVVERERVRDFTDRQRLGTRETETFAYTITVRNNKGRGVALIVEDQVPLATDDAIDVNAEVDDGGTLEAATGLVRWRLTLLPNVTETLDFAFTVRYPRGRRPVFGP